MSAVPLLAVNRLTVARGLRVVLADVDLEICNGERILVLGENGAGKTTLLDALIGLVPSSADSRTWLSYAKTPADAHALESNELVYVPQANNLFPSLTVRENLLLCGLSKSRSLAASRLRGFLERLPELGVCISRYPAQLSTGQRQLVAAARAFLFRPRLLVLDEPTAGMNGSLVESFHTLLFTGLADETAVLVTEQHVDAVRPWVTRKFHVLPNASG